ncbi:uncharacterized protein [Rutidosis leptorrhynchoides]|uniref:uncharacterized protein isoform X1 n=1 Tax=Rutidosis leptorrhynchoides TaxID=125765 RepID=UPI003A9A456C
MAPKKREKRSAENANASLEGIKDNAFVANISSVSSRKTDIQNMLNYRNHKANLSSDRSLFVVGLSGDLKLKAIVHCFCYTVLGSSEVMDARSLTTNSSSEDCNAIADGSGSLLQLPVYNAQI